MLHARWLPEITIRQEQPAKSSAAVQAKKQRKQTEGGFPAQSFPTLLQALATQITRITQTTPRQAKAFELLGF